MLRNATIPLGRAWNTWSSRPAEMVFLPLGVRLTPLAYSDKLRKATLFPPGEDVRYGPHGIDASLVELGLSHGGTRLAWSYRKPGPFDVSGRWRTLASGEWGLRFWVNLCLSSEEGREVRYDPATRAAVVKVDHRFVALATSAEPVQVTGHASVEALAQEYEAQGYFYLASRSTAAPVIALRFNLEMMCEARFAAAVADREDLAVARANELAAAEPPEPELPVQDGQFEGCLDAVRDVMAWNTVWDEINGRPYTSISRNWNLAKFGGFGVWLNDQQYAAAMTGLFDPELARENLAASLASATPDGNLACLITAQDAWVDRSQLPLGSFLVWLLYLRTGSRTFVELAYDTLKRNHDWWWTRRDPLGRGLASYGTSDLGEGLYKGTSFGARNESSMDNAPIHDEAEYDPATRTLTTEDVGLNSLLALDAEMLAAMATSLGRATEAQTHAAVAERTRSKIREELWDDARGLFANRLRSGRFVESVGPTSFYPLLCGAAMPEQARRLVGHLEDASTFGGPFLIPSVARKDAAFQDNTYWRGRIWPPLNFLVWHGLVRYGFRAEASRLAEASVALFRRSWQSRLAPENFNAETGEALDQADTEGFYSWGALMPVLGVGEVMDVNPWHGWEVANNGEPARLGPLQSPAGAVTVTIVDGVLTLAKAERVLLASNVRGRLSQLRFADGQTSLDLPPRLAPDAFVALPSLRPQDVILARLGDQEVSCQAEGEGIAFKSLPRSEGPLHLLVVHR